MKGAIHSTLSYLCVLSLFLGLGIGSLTPKAFAGHTLKKGKGHSTFSYVDPITEEKNQKKITIHDEQASIEFHVRPADDYFKKNHLIYLELNGEDRELSRDDLKSEEQNQRNMEYYARGAYLVDNVFHNFFLHPVKEEDFLNKYDELLAFANEEAFGFFLTTNKYEKLMNSLEANLPKPSANIRAFYEKKQELGLAIIVNYYIHHGYKIVPTPIKTKVFFKSHFHFKIERIFSDMEKISFFEPAINDIRRKGIIYLKNLAADYFSRNEAYLRYSEKLTKDYFKALSSYHKGLSDYGLKNLNLEKILSEGHSLKEYNHVQYSHSFKEAINFYNAIPENERPGTNFLKRPIHEIASDIKNRSHSLSNSEDPYTKFYLLFYAKLKALGLEYSWNEVASDLKDLVFEADFDQLKQEVMIQYTNLIFPLIKDPITYLKEGTLVALLDSNNYVDKKIRNQVFERFLSIHSDYFVDEKSSSYLNGVLPLLEKKTDGCDYRYDSIVNKLIRLYNIEDGSFDFLHSTMGPAI